MKNNRSDFVIIAIILVIGIGASEFMANQIGYTHFGFEQPKIQIKNHKTLD